MGLTKARIGVALSSAGLSQLIKALLAQRA